MDCKRPQTYISLMVWLRFYNFIPTCRVYTATPTFITHSFNQFHLWLRHAFAAVSFKKAYAKSHLSFLSRVSSPPQKKYINILYWWGGPHPSMNPLQNVQEINNRPDLCDGQVRYENHVSAGPPHISVVRGGSYRGYSPPVSCLLAVNEDHQKYTLQKSLIMFPSPWITQHSEL